MDEIEKLKKGIEDRNQKRRDRELYDVKQVLSTVEGRRFIWRLLDTTRVFATCYDKHNGDMAWNEGRRDIGLMVWNDVTLSLPEKYVQMQREYRSEKQKDEKEKSDFESKIKKGDD